MTQSQIYLIVTYVCEADTEVVGVDASDRHARIALAANIFHPQGGGQPHDHGSVAGIDVTPVKDAETDMVWLTLPDEAEVRSSRFTAGAQVSSRIDPKLRRLHAALHTAAEALPVTAGERDGKRTITIEGLATEFCGGTHVTDLSMLTDVAVRSVKVKSGRLRIGYAAEHVKPGGEG
ncbi:alanyl-tRNA synthetase [Streptomyces sp. NPDC047860]|uniref:alanyl-tRNA synthetase n=1 Tax=Streptomyces sp. NPDC047860 TaxID=3155743 RepID=UPI0033D78B34